MKVRTALSLSWPASDAVDVALGGVDATIPAMIHHDAEIDSVPLAVVDVETTGLSAFGGDRICEIAVLRVDPDGKESVFHSLINPCCQISAGASAVNGITDADVAGAPLFSAIAMDIVAAMAGAALVAHNLPFDRGFLDAEMRRVDGPAAANPAIDTLALARTYFSFPSNTLGTVARLLGVPVERAHRAEGDARTTLGILRQMRPHLESRGVRSLADYVRASAGVPPSRGGFIADIPPAIESALASGDAVEISYRSGGRLASRRIVRPLRLQGSYLIAFCELRRDERTFRLDRIVSVRFVGRTGPARSSSARM